MQEFNYFLALEAELESSFNYIEPNKQNYKCYGAKYASLLNAVSVEFETTAKTLIHTLKPSAKVGSISQIKSELLSLFPKIGENKVQITRIGKTTVKPFENWSNSKLEWWTSYTELKHNRVKNYHEANLKNLLSAMSSLLVLLIYLERFRDKTKKLRTERVFWMEVMPAIRSTSGGDIPDTDMIN